MTFDEALDELEPRTIWSGEMRDLLEQLRQEYAPTVEMTKDKVNQLNGIVHTVSEEFEENELPDDGSVKITDKMIELEDGFVLLKDLNVIIHPETIKIIDEEVD